MLQIVASLTIVIYDHNSFIIQVTALTMTSSKDRQIKGLIEWMDLNVETHLSIKEEVEEDERATDTAVSSNLGRYYGSS